MNQAVVDSNAATIRIVRHEITTPTMRSSRDDAVATLRVRGAHQCRTRRRAGFPFRFASLNANGHRALRFPADARGSS